MFQKLKHTFKQTAIYSLGNISTKLIGFILLPLYTDPKYLSVDEYGRWAILEVTSQIIIGVLALNLPLAMLRWSSAELNKEKVKSIIFTTIFSLFIIIAVSLLFLLPNTEYFSELIFKTKEYTPYFFMLFILSSFGIYNGVPLNIIRIKEKSVFYVIVTSLKFTVILLLNIYFVVYEHEGVIGIIKGQLIGEAFLSFLTLPMVVKSSRIKIDLETLSEMIRYGAPLVFSTISSFIFSFGDRYVMQHYLDESKVAIYSLAYKIAGVMNMLILQSFQLGFLPIAYKKLGDPDEKRFFMKVLTYYTLLLTFVGLAISLFSKELLELFTVNKEYWAAASIIPIITLAFIIKGIQYNFALSFHYSKKTIYNAAIVIGMAFFSLTLNVILIQKIGYIGAACSMLISMIVMMLLSYYFGQKVHPIPFELLKLFKIIIVGVIIYISSPIISDIELSFRLVIKIFLLLLFPLVIYKSSILEEIEITSFIRGIKDFKNLISRKN